MLSPTERSTMIKIFQTITKFHVTPYRWSEGKLQPNIHRLKYWILTILNLIFITEAFLQAKTAWNQRSFDLFAVYGLLCCNGFGMIVIRETLWRSTADITFIYNQLLVGPHALGKCGD